MPPVPTLDYAMRAKVFGALLHHLRANPTDGRHSPGRARIPYNRLPGENRGAGDENGLPASTMNVASTCGSALPPLDTCIAKSAPWPASATLAAGRTNEKTASRAVFKGARIGDEPDPGTGHNS